MGTAHFGAAILALGAATLERVFWREVFLARAFLARPFWFWRCDRKNEYRRRIHHDLNNNFVKMVNEHSHEANIANVKQKKIVTGIKRRAAECMELPSQLRANAMVNVSTPVFAQCTSAVTELRRSNTYYRTLAFFHLMATILNTAFSPASILMGFEQAAMDAAVADFKIDRSDPVFEETARMITALAFVPIQHLTAAITALTTSWGKNWTQF
ncbi:hypothetical protein niasHS_016321 [Heterodera schachtii]|uniref:Uncharacterized protein n=1 Tax=Heterodera schachtii TaxID=97005 RepID=A0ABD2HXD9_HETSC